MHVIPSLETLRQADQEFKASLSYVGNEFEARLGCVRYFL